VKESSSLNLCNQWKNCEFTTVCRTLHPNIRTVVCHVVIGKQMPHKTKIIATQFREASVVDRCTKRGPFLRSC
jgi:hypothetical protein